MELIKNLFTSPQIAKNRKRPPCPGLWKTPVIRHDGELMACCADLENNIKVGNLREAGFKQLWEGEAMTRYRLLHIEGRFEEMPTCESCAGINFYTMTSEDIRRYLESVGRLDLYPQYLERLGLAGGSAP
ncbi:MAG: hypothetical protein GMKNLPBB_02891 [Myxococcota bacterium]|nr:hypothetical protein [Myxococcota bacterium]